MGEQAGERGGAIWWKFFWLLSLLAIPLLSFYGRSLQLCIQNHFSMEQLGLYLGMAMAGMVLVFLLALLSSGLDGYVYHLIWVAALSVLLYSYLPFVEKIHVALFGLFGFISYWIFKEKTAMLTCVAIAALDELFQYFLANRVGDWRDVWLNVFSVSLGMFLAFLLMTDGQGRVAGEAGEG